jgi:hypothetical protein
VGGTVSAAMPVIVANVSFAVLLSGVALRMLLQLRRR